MSGPRVDECGNLNGARHLKLCYAHNSSKPQIAANPWRPQGEKEKINGAVELHKMQNMGTENGCTTAQ